MSFLSREVLRGNFMLPAVPVDGLVLLFVHGGARDPEQNLFPTWRKHLAQMGYATVGFTFQGIGTSEGEFQADSLAGRIIDVVAAIDSLLATREFKVQCICLVASSMGGHVAVRAARLRAEAVRALILLNPAAYSAEAERMTFGEPFRQAHSKRESWRHSPVYSDLAQLEVPILLLLSEWDDRIPPGVRQRYRQALPTGAVVRVLTGVGHSFDTREDPIRTATWQSICDQTARFLGQVFTHAGPESQRL